MYVKSKQVELKYKNWIIMLLLFLCSLINSFKYLGDYLVFIFCYSNNYQKFYSLITAKTKKRLWEQLHINADNNVVYLRFIWFEPVVAMSSFILIYEATKGYTWYFKVGPPLLLCVMVPIKLVRYPITILAENSLYPMSML